MNILVTFGLFSILFLGGLTINSVSAQIDPLTDIVFFQTGELNTTDNQFQISDKLNIREFFNGDIIRISGLTLEGFPYITYSRVLEEQINTHGVIFIQGEFKKLNFDEKIKDETIVIEKDDDILLLLKYTQRAYSEKTLYVDVKIYDKDQNKLNDFDQNYGFISDVNINVKITNEDEQIVFSSNGVTNENGLFETQYLIPENSKRETLILTIDAENESSATSKMLQVFSLGQIPDNDSN
jgi:hypothetical protein